uniref:Uncharacterized protein n=1 Tax=Rhizophora mucronata TaxID=61149 RepID=A0A2P2Q1D2_RHIMU
MFHMHDGKKSDVYKLEQSKVNDPQKVRFTRA